MAVFCEPILSISLIFVFKGSLGLNIRRDYHRTPGLPRVPAYDLSHKNGDL